MENRGDLLGITVELLVVSFQEEWCEQQRLHDLNELVSAVAGKQMNR